MASPYETRARLQSLIEELITTGDIEAIRTAEYFLRIILRCAVQTGHSKVFPEYARDAVHDFVRKAKKGKKQ